MSGEVTTLRGHVISAIVGLAFVLAALFACAKQETASSNPAAPGDLDRTALPIAEPTYPAITELDARTAKAPPIFEVKAPAGAPNVIVILLDNFGYAGSKTFGGVMNLPTLDRLAKNGLIYNNFHTAPICSASRVALLTGRNPHSANMGTVSEMATAFPGQNSVLPNSVAPLAKIMRFNGYSTAMFGKSHEYVAWESGLTGPFDQWPTGLGFEKFYGNVIGESDQFSPVGARQYDAGRSIEGSELLLPDGHCRPCHPMDQDSEDAQSGQAVLRLLRCAGHA